MLPLYEWWTQQSRAELVKIGPQIHNYGAFDLEIMGRVLGDMVDGVSQLDRAEIGCGFYLLGKVSRMMSAYREGREPSRDTIMDIIVYARMILRIRDSGGWPGPTIKKESE
jgi:hypothetical protein